MVKGQKSSATSGTRKKNARKAAAAQASSGAPPPTPVPPSRPPKTGKTKQSKREARETRKKVYIPPVKPAPPVLDPLDTTGLAHALPPELVIVLRSLGKKDAVTRAKAVEELARWVEDAIREQVGKERETTSDEYNEVSEKASMVVDMLPVWLHRAPVLFTHPARRLRLLAASLQASLLRLTAAREALLQWTTETTTENELYTLIGTWLTLAHDIDRSVAAVGQRAWTDFISTSSGSDFESGWPPRSHRHHAPPKFVLGQPLTGSLLVFAYRTVLDPAGLHAALNPAPIPATVPPNTHQASGRGYGQGKEMQQGSQGRRVPQSKKDVPTPQPTKSSQSTEPVSTDDSEESELDRAGRLRVGALGAIKWVIGALSQVVPLLQTLTSLLSSTSFWSTLHPSPACPYSAEVFGFNQPQVRQAAWTLVGSLVKYLHGSIPPVILRTISSAILRSAWVETDVGVRAMLGGPLVQFLGHYPSAWTIDEEWAARGYYHDGKATDGENVDADDRDEEGSSSEAESSEDENATGATEGDQAEIRGNKLGEGELQQTSSGSCLPSQAFREFLQFLELGCSGSPAEGYPMVLLIVAGIPETVRSFYILDVYGTTPLLSFLEALWSPLDARLLDRRVAAPAWLRALLECLVFIVRKACQNATSKDLDSGGASGGTDTVIERAKHLLSSHLNKLYSELSTKRLRIEEREAAEIVVGALCRVQRLGEDLFDAAFDALSSSMTSSTVLDDTTAQAPLGLAPTFLQVFASTFSDMNTWAGKKTRSLLERYVRDTVAVVAGALEKPVKKDMQVSEEYKDDRKRQRSLDVLVKLMDTFGSSLFSDAEFTSRVDALFLAHPLALLKMSPEGEAITSYLRHRSSSGTSSLFDPLARMQEFWSTLLTAVASESSPTPLLLILLTAAHAGALPSHLGGSSEAMDELVLHLVEEAVSSVEDNLLAGKMLSVSTFFLSSNGLINVASLLSRNIVAVADNLITRAGSPDTVDEVEHLDSAADLLRADTSLSLVKKFKGEVGVEMYAGVFLLAWVVPPLDEGGAEERAKRMSLTSGAGVEDAQALWTAWIAENGQGHLEMRQAVEGLVKEKIRDVLVDEQAETRPEHLIRTLCPPPPGFHVDVLADIIPSRIELDGMLDSSKLPSAFVSTSLALLDPVVPTWSVGHVVSALSSPTRGATSTSKQVLKLNTYARATCALLAYFSISRTLARSNLWALRHLLALGVYANEYVQVEATQSLVFGREDGSESGREAVRELVDKIKSLTTYLLGRVEEGIHARAAGALLRKEMGKGATVTGGGNGYDDGSLAAFVIDVVERAKKADAVRDSLVLRTVLQHILEDAIEEDADLWLSLARKLGKTAPQTTISILTSIAEHVPEPHRLDRYRNELAASLLGVRPRDSTSTGLSLLRLLAATAPHPDSDVIFLPQQRAVNVMKVCQAWIAAEDGSEEDVESAMTLIFLHLAPILQSIPGSHWEFIWDVNCSLRDSTTLTTLGRSLRLVLTIQDLTSTNKPLRASWEERKSAILALIKDIVAVDTRAMPYSAPRSLCRELALTAIQDMPSSMMTETTLPTMCHLLTDQSQEVQRMSYYLFHNAARKRTEHLVIESAVDTEDAVKPELPAELVAILQTSPGFAELLDPDDQFPSRDQASGYLLAWMITFDLFMDASMKVRSGYFNHMRSLNIICRHFIPNIFEALGLYSGGKKVFKLDVWAVDEFYLEAFEPESSLSLQLLAAHLYHRALLTVPALIRSWISDCTDKQLLGRVVEYTSSYFSPGIIKAELAQVKQPDTSSELAANENLSVKVSLASGEVTASYAVDEQALELSIRLPSDWPLHRLEVRDTKMVGVSEDKWRAWVLGVQQVVWQQNGRIVDGLTLFTKNVTLHFAGQVECAICYSIISAMDASLPQKPCKTCKNRFHASCLYKWFKTSHSSSCPLCRSDIL
ncbi:hypothetical protein F5I97DRAFT_1939442 [Phlebopus sp. FC_14]|nr:hypothetical protein F5I97DRAFT_1939442 [Phlebopus sp. FC_14]